MKGWCTSMDDLPAVKAEQVGWQLWGVRWFWLVVAGLTAAGLGRGSRAAIAGYLAVQVAVTLDLLRSQGPDRRLTWLGVAADSVAPAVILAGAGGPVGPAWAITMAGPSSLAAVSGLWFGWAGAWVSLLLAGVLLGFMGDGLTAGLMLTGLHAVVLLPASLATAWCSHQASRVRRWSDRRMSPMTDTGWTGRWRMASEGALTPDQLLEDLLSMAAEWLAATGLAGDEMSGAALRGQPGGWTMVAGAVEGEPGTGGGGALAEAVASGRPEICRDPGADPVLGPWAVDEGWASAVCLPLVSGEACYGALVVGHQRPDAFAAAQLDALAALGLEARVALPYADLYRRLSEERDQLTELQEEARKKLARDLHDGPTQVIAAIAMRTNFARRQLSIDKGAADQELEKVEEMARDTTREIRHMLFTLRPLILESQGLVAALRQYANKVQDTHNLTVELEADDSIERDLGPEEQGSLFYIAEEAVNNAQKHAAAAVVSVRLYRSEDQVILEVRDNGVGFNVGEVDRTYEQRGSLGMVTMRERTQLLGGTFEVESEEGVGTLIRVTVPIGKDR